MKKNIVILIFLLLGNYLYSQVECTITNLKIENYIFDEDSYYEEDYAYGPILTLNVKIFNRGIDTLCITPSKANISFCFNYRGKRYQTNQTCLYEPITEKSFVISPSAYVEFVISTELLNETNLKYSFKKNYTSLLLCIIPTYKLEYKENNISFISTQINNVELFPSDHDIGGSS